MSYHDLAVKHGTDKAYHGYMPFYERLFARDFPDLMTPKILEIGCEKGNSLRMWHDIFPQARLFTLDLFQEFDYPFDMDHCLRTFTGNQTDSELLHVVRETGPYDMIIDDGSHNSRDQLISFYGLVGCCSVYVVEDLHCCKEESYRQGMTFEQTMLGQMQNQSFPFPFELHKDKISFIYG